MSSQTYDSDLTDAEWEVLNGVWPPRTARGAPSRWSTREIVSAVLYVLCSVTAWRALPHDFPPWQTMYDHFRQLKMVGVWERIHRSWAASHT